MWVWLCAFERLLRDSEKEDGRCEEREHDCGLKHGRQCVEVLDEGFHGTQSSITRSGSTSVSLFSQSLVNS